MLFIDAVEIVKKLSKHFGVQEPKLLEARFNARRSYYYGGNRREIHLVTGTSSTLDHLLHEFAHHLNNVKNTGRHHDEGFITWLKLVAREFYRDESLYAWDCEYKDVKRYASNKGWLK